VLERLGVCGGSHVVLCHQLADATAAGRVYITLDHLGMGGRTSILDGGLEAWKAEGRPVTREIPRYKRCRLVAHPRPGVIARLEQVRAASADSAFQLVDARSPQAFRAAAGPATVRGGHLPGAVNLPFTTLTDSLGRFLPADSLKARFERAGVQPGRRVIAYCYSGRTACPVYVAAKLLGYEVQLYDGSFEEWSRREDLPVEGVGKK
jgi:thiosulfate/3-mercaptopyruvate sulfurtransferase